MAGKPSAYAVDLAPAAYRSLRRVKDKRVRREIARVIDGLSTDAERHGKALLGPLEGLRSVRAARSRYRIIFAVDRPRRVVSVLLVGEREAGEREDIYALAEKLLKTFLRGGI